MNTQTREIIDFVRTRRNNGTAKEKVVTGLRLKFPIAARREAARTLLGTDVPLKTTETIVDLMYRDTPFDNPPVNEGEQDARARL